MMRIEFEGDLRVLLYQKLSGQNSVKVSLEERSGAGKVQAPNLGISLHPQVP